MHIAECVHVGAYAAEALLEIAAWPLRTMMLSRNISMALVPLQWRRHGARAAHAGAHAKLQMHAIMMRDSVRCRVLSDTSMLPTSVPALHEDEHAFVILWRCNAERSQACAIESIASIGAPSGHQACALRACTKPPGGSRQSIS